MIIALTTQAYQKRQEALLPLIAQCQNERELVDRMQERKKLRSWVSSTLTTNLVTVQSTCKTIGFTTGPLLKSAVKLAAQNAREEPVDFPHPATLANIIEARTRCTVESISIIILLAWMIAARTGDTIQLATSSFSTVGNFLAVRFTKGKTVKVIGPYTIHLPLHNQDVQTIVRWVNRQPLGYPFGLQTPKCREKTGETVKWALRVADSRLEQRSIRRGALTHLAMMGVPMQDLLMLSKHRDESMLLRYLAWGTFAVDRAITTSKCVTLLTSECSTLDGP